MNLGIFLDTTQSREDKKGFFPIKAQLDINNSRIQFVLPKLKLKPEHWCNETKRAKPETPDNALINLLIDRAQARFDEAKEIFEREGHATTTFEIKKILLGKETPKLDLSGMIDKFIEHYQNLRSVGKTSPSTPYLYKYYAKIWKGFFIKQERLREPKQITAGMKDDLYLYVLRNTKGKRNPHNNAVSSLGCMRTFLNFCLDREWITSNPFARIRHKKEDKDLVFLESCELEAIRLLDLGKKKRLTEMKQEICF